jgi:hypothetical protein
MKNLYDKVVSVSAGKPHLRRILEVEFIGACIQVRKQIEQATYTCGKVEERREGM